MSETLLIRPTYGHRVPYPPGTGPGKKAVLPRDGARVPRSAYWLRRLAAKEVELFKPDPPSKARRKATKTTGD